MKEEPTKGVVKDGLYVLGGHYFAQVCNLIRGFYSANILGPAGYGLWSIIQFYLEFGKFIPLGMDEFAARQFSQNIGNKKYDENLNIIRCFFLFTLITAVAILVSGYLVLFFWGDKDNPIQYFGIIFVTGSLIATLFDRFIYAFLTSHGYFKRTALVRQLQAVISLTVVFLLMARYRILAMYWAYFLMLSLSIVFISLLSVKPIFQKLRATFSAPRIQNAFWPLLKASLFLFVVNIVNSGLTNLERFFITRHYNTYDNGIYFFAANISMSLNLFVFSFTVVLYQRMNLLFGKNQRADEIFHYALSACKKVALLFPYLIAISFYIIPAFFKLFFKQYEASIFFLRCLSINGYFYSLFFLLTYQLMAARQQIQLLYLSLVFIGSGTILYEWATRNFPLDKIPFFVIPLNMIFLFITLLAAKTLAKVSYPLRKIIRDMLFFPIIFGLLIAVFEMVVIPGDSPRDMTLKSLAVSLSYFIISLLLKNRRNLFDPAINR
jgi:O-antigen/teichoic acid export membrane protein